MVESTSTGGGALVRPCAQLAIPWAVGVLAASMRAEATSSEVEKGVWVTTLPVESYLRWE